MRNPAARRCLLLPAAALLVLPIFGCSSPNLFHGRLVLVNTTGGEIRSITLDISCPGLRQAFDLPELADGRAWVRDCGGDDPVVVLGDLTVSYLDPAGATRVHKVPFAGAIPENCRDDFAVEVGPDGQLLRSGLLAYRNPRVDAAAAVTTHALAGAAGLLLGWLIWRNGRGRAARPHGHPVKLLTPEL